MARSSPILRKPARGRAVGAASALDCAALSVVLGALHGARFCEVEGLPMEELDSMLAELVPVIGTEVKHLGLRIQADRYGDSQAALRTYAAAARLVERSRETRINADFPNSAARAFGRGIDAGFETEDLAALIRGHAQKCVTGSPTRVMHAARPVSQHSFGIGENGARPPGAGITMRAADRRDEARFARAVLDRPLQRPALCRLLQLTDGQALGLASAAGCRRAVAPARSHRIGAPFACLVGIAVQSFRNKAS